MKIFKIFLCILMLTPVVRCDEPISIVINAGAANATFEFHGKIENDISNEDKDAFDITDDNLKRGVEALMGAWPNYVSLGHWQDIYKQRKWTPVKITLKPIKGKVIRISSEPVIVSTHTLNNLFSNKATFKAGISTEVRNSITSSWFQSLSKTVGDQISFGINFKVPGANGSELSGGISSTNSISFTSNWGVRSYKETSIAVGSSSEVLVDLEPGQEAVAVLSATKGSIEVQIDYLTSLQGNVACEFSKTYRGRYYWRQDINTVLSAIDMPIHILSRQTLKIGYYSEAKVTLTDRTSNKTLYEGPGVFRT
ncbi:spherulin-2A-like [Ostrinia furnacalis]|uniref:spherulin-2A-like n=1 Tax=Ostrinia furnacalis TaxID=93504 RepID=UPI0010395759|nr:spherulin-2A-like [Ostrinia furnacalis]